MLDSKPKNEEAVELLENYMMLYGVNVNLQRAIPMISDGLKPVVRRILYMMHKNHRNSEAKVNEAIGEVMAIHPHGDQGMGAIYAKLAQSFSNNVPLLSTTETGNSGNATTGDDFAAPRYLSINISKFTLDVLFDEFDTKVNMKPTYDGSKIEPVILPAKFPIILLNGTSGIGYTLSTEIHPYNINEVADATIKLLKNPDAKIKLIPDSPTGCDIIIGRNNETFTMQSSFDIDNVNYTITIKNTPYLKYLDDINARLCDIQSSDMPIDEIISADDESILLENKISYVIRCKPCNLYKVVNTLFKRVPGFRNTLSTHNMCVVDNEFRIKYYNPRQILCCWIDWRLTEKRKYFIRTLVSLNKEINMLEGKSFMLNDKNLNRTVGVFRKCNKKEDIIPSLVKEYDGAVTSSQANYISELRLYQLNSGEYKKTLELLKKTEDDVKYYRGLLDDPNGVREIVIDEIRTIKQKFGNPRRSKILNLQKDVVNNIGVVQRLIDGSVLFSETENPEHLSSDVTPISGEKVCLIDEKGLFVWVDTNRVEQNKPITLTSVGRQRMGNCIACISNLSNNVLILTNRGRVKYMQIDNIPTNATMKPLIPTDADEFIVDILEISPSNNPDILIYTSDGYGKRIQSSALNKQTSVDAQGQFLLKGFETRGMFCINPNKPLLVYVTRLGRMRVNNAKFLTTAKNKFGDCKSIIKLSPQDDLVAVFCAESDQSVVLNHIDSRVSTVYVNSLPVTTMAIEPTRPKHVPGVKVVRATLN